MPEKIKKFLIQNKTSFSRSTVTSFIAGIVDFGSLYLMVEYLSVFYVTATALAAFFGAIVNFTLNRFWAFDHGGAKLNTQAFKYGIVSAGSLALNTLFVYLLTDYLHIAYMVSKLVTSFIVSITWNYFLQRYYVFTKPARSS